MNKNLTPEQKHILHKIPEKINNHLLDPTCGRTR